MIPLIRSDLGLAALVSVPAVMGAAMCALAGWVPLAVGCASAAPINLAAALVATVAMHGPTAVGFAGILAALLVRVVGVATAALAIHLLAPGALTGALAALCVLLLTGLGSEAWWHTRHPSSTGSTRV